MAQYQKQILSISQQLQSYIDAGMAIPSTTEAENVLKTIGYYGLRGYRRKIIGYQQILS